MEKSRTFLEQMGLPGRDPDDSPISAKRFSDGDQYRFEIPGAEGPKALAAIVSEAKERKVPVHRASTAVSILLLTDEEISEMLETGSRAGIEVTLRLGPRSGRDAVLPLGMGLRGADELVYAMEDLKRAVRLGLRSVEVADIGILQIIVKMRAAGELPAELVVNTSVLLAAANPAVASLLAELGADTIEIPPDLTVPQIAAIRSAISVPIVLYVEAPEGFGGFNRHHEIPGLIRAAAPVYLKFGMRDAPEVVSAGPHAEEIVAALCRERVRRAEIAHEIVTRFYPEAAVSPHRAGDVGRAAF